MSKRLIWMCTVATLLWWSTPAFAQDVPTTQVELPTHKSTPQDIEDAQKLAAEALEEYGKKNYNGAINLLLQAIARHPHPAYVASISLSYALIDDCLSARAWMDLSGKAQVGDFVLSEDDKATLAYVDKKCPAPKIDDPEVDKELDGVGKGDGKGEKKPPETPLDTNLWVGIGGSAVGVGLFVGAVLLDQAILDDIDTLRTMQNDPDRAAFDALSGDIDSDKTTLGFLYAGAAVFTAAGVFFLATSDTISGEEPTPPAESTPEVLGVTPWVAPDSAGVGVIGRF